MEIRGGFLQRLQPPDLPLPTDAVIWRKTSTCVRTALAQPTGSDVKLTRPPDNAAAAVPSRTWRKATRSCTHIYHIPARANHAHTRWKHMGRPRPLSPTKHLGGRDMTCLENLKTRISGPLSFSHLKKKHTHKSRHVTMTGLPPTLSSGLGKIFFSIRSFQL